MIFKKKAGLILIGMIFLFSLVHADMTYTNPTLPKLQPMPPVNGGSGNGTTIINNYYYNSSTNYTNVTIVYDNNGNPVILGNSHLLVDSNNFPSMYWSARLLLTPNSYIAVDYSHDDSLNGNAHVMINDNNGEADNGNELQVYGNTSSDCYVFGDNTIQCSASSGGSSSPWTNDSTTIYPVDITKRVLVGGASDDGSSALQVNGEENVWKIKSPVTGTSFMDLYTHSGDLYLESQRPGGTPNSLYVGTLGTDGGFGPNYMRFLAESGFQFNNANAINVTLADANYAINANGQSYFSDSSGDTTSITNGNSAIEAHAGNALYAIFAQSYDGYIGILGNQGQAGYFTDSVSSPTKSVSLVDGTYAISATGNANINGGLVVSPYSYTAQNGEGVFDRVTVMGNLAQDGIDAQSDSNGNVAAGYFHDAYTNVRLAYTDGSIIPYAINSNGNMLLNGNVSGSNNICLSNGSNCQSSGGSSSPWSNDSTTIFPVDTSQRVLIGGATDNGGSLNVIAGSNFYAIDAVGSLNHPTINSNSWNYGFGLQTTYEDSIGQGYSLYANDGNGNSALLADGIYAIQATGNTLLNGNLTVNGITSLDSGNIYTDGAGTLTGITLSASGGVGMGMGSVHDGVGDSMSSGYFQDRNGDYLGDGNLKVLGNANITGNITASNICYTSGNCASSGGMNYTNLALTNQSNTFIGNQNFTNDFYSHDNSFYFNSTSNNLYVQTAIISNNVTIAGIYYYTTTGACNLTLNGSDCNNITNRYIIGGTYGH